MENLFTCIDQCRCCGSTNLIDILDLGKQPLANSLKDAADKEDQEFPLSTVQCTDCFLYQNKETIKKEVLFDHYVWVTGTSAGAKDYCESFYERVVHVGELKKDDLVVEIASNDGTFLQPFVKGGYRVLGVEPALNIAKMAQEASVPTLAAYWGTKTAKKINTEAGKPKIVIARNVMPHVSMLHDVVDGIHASLGDDSVGVIEFHDAGAIQRELHYDSIYHEHLSYFTLKTMSHLLKAHGLFIFDLDTSPISGGSYVIYFTKERRSKSAKYTDAIAREKDSRVNETDTWLDFAKRVHEHRAKTKELLEAFSGRTIIGFGASARSSTYLNFCGLTNKDIQCIIDNNPLKQGRYTAGSSIPIVTMEQGLALKPELLFVLAWNFKDEIIHSCQDKEYRGEYLIPFPDAPYLQSSIHEGSLV